LNSKGRVKARWNSYQARSRFVVMQRCRDSCEGCPIPTDRLHWHHAFGRRNIIAEPLASHPTMTAGLCAGCHRDVHAEPDGMLARYIQKSAILRAFQEWRIERNPDDHDWIGQARALETMLRDDGTWEALKIEAGL
jgi:predicted Fe-S protein YdhL (DUF1289 family)